jgi:hypothetical protein
VSGDSKIETGTRLPDSGTATSQAGSSGAVTRSPVGVSSGTTRSIWLTSRAVIASPSSSTSIQRRSPARPHGSTVASSTAAPWQDFTGKWWIEVRRPSILGE